MSIHKCFIASIITLISFFGSYSLKAEDSVSNYVNLNPLFLDGLSPNKKIINHINKVVIKNSYIDITKRTFEKVFYLRPSPSFTQNFNTGNYNDEDFDDRVSILGYLGLETLNPETGIREIIFVNGLDQRSSIETSFPVQQLSDAFGVPRDMMDGIYLDDQPMVCPRGYKRSLLSKWEEADGKKKEIYTCMRLQCVRQGHGTEGVSGGYDPVDCFEKERRYKRRLDIIEKFGATGVLDLSELSDFEKGQMSYFTNFYGAGVNKDKTIYGSNGGDLFMGYYKNCIIYGGKGDNVFSAGENVIIYGGSGKNIYFIGNLSNFSDFITVRSANTSGWFKSGFVIKDFKMNVDYINLSPDGTDWAIKQNLVYPAVKNMIINVDDQGDGKIFKITIGNFYDADTTKTFSFSVSTTETTTTTELLNKIKGENYYVALTDTANEFIPEDFGGYARPFINMGAGATIARRGGVATSFQIVSGPEKKTLKNFDMKRDRIFINYFPYRDSSKKPYSITAIKVTEKSTGVFSVVIDAIENNILATKNIEVHLGPNQNDVTAIDLEKKIWAENRPSRSDGDCWQDCWPKNQPRDEPLWYQGEPSGLWSNN